MIDIVALSRFLNTPGVEGPRRIRGYVPCQPGNFAAGPGQRPEVYTAIGASGVTIATGCDLGQTDIASLRGYGVPETLIGALSPYIGLKKIQAINRLASLPLLVSEDAAASLDHAVHAGYLRRYVIPAYERESATPFADLPFAAQAVVFSLCFQKGCGGVRRDWPRVWGQLARGDWAAASQELLTGFTQYRRRREIEGRLLQEVC